MFISIHQPDYLPWQGYFNKIKASETFVFLDTASYSRDGFHNRNKIKTGEGAWTYLTIPMPHTEIFKPMTEAKLPPNSSWATKHWRSIENHYRRAPYWSEYAPQLEALFNEAKTYTTLADLNVQVIQKLMELMGLSTKTVRATELGLAGEVGSEQILAICKKLGATEYLSGGSGKRYLDLDAFRQEGIKVIFQDFHAPQYRQLFRDFVPGLSVVDLLFNEGQGSVQYL